MTIEPIVDWILLLPSEMKLTIALAALILVFAFASLRPGDPTI
jgi:hypothetical protein